MYRQVIAEKAISRISCKRNMMLEDCCDNSDEIDELASQILDEIISRKDDLSIEFIIEQLTYLGQAPNILYDDNGNFAVTGDGFQSIEHIASKEGTGDVSLSFFIEKENWKDTIRKALYYYLDKT